jgi:DNA-binding transcriptional regulator YhcF (GntR family)
MDEIKGKIAAGQLGPGAKIDSIRELAASYVVNPNTVQRALLELERDGLLFTQRASGKFVTEDAEMIRKLRSSLAADRLETFLSAMEALGFNTEETLELLTRAQDARRRKGAGRQKEAKHE